MKALGERLRQLRRERRLTILDVVKKTGIDQATLSRMENGKMTGTFECHVKLAQAFGMRIPDFYGFITAKLEEAKEKNVENKALASSGLKGIQAQLLTGNLLQKKMMPLILKLKPKSRTDTEKFAFGAERFVYIIKGSLEICVGEEGRMLSEAESLYFDASTPHHFKNTGRTEASFLSISTPVSR